MSFGVLALAVQAAKHHEHPLDDEDCPELTCASGVPETLHVRWAAYRSEGAGVLWGVAEVTVEEPW